MKILITGDDARLFDTAADIRAIDGRIYPDDEVEPVFKSMVNGLFMSPKLMEADMWIDTEGRSPLENVVITDDHRMNVKALRKAIARLYSASKKNAESYVLPTLPAAVLDLVSKPSELPRNVYFDGIKCEDWTPFSFFANPVADFMKSSVDVWEWENTQLEGASETILSDRDLKVTQFALSRWDELCRTQVEQKLKYSSHPMNESGLAFLLPPPGYVASDGKENKTGQHGICFGSELFKRFSTELCKRRMARVDDVSNREDAISHAYMMRQDYSLWPASVQQVYASDEYRLELTSEEDQLLQTFSEMMELYYSFIEGHIDDVLSSNISDIQMSLKPLKSPGTDVVMPDGELYDRKLAWYVPNEHFATGNMEKNAYASFSYKPLKEMLSPYIVPSVKERLRGLRDGKLHDAAWEFDMVMRGCAREGTVAWRINAPDKPRFMRRSGSTFEPDPNKETYVPSWDSDEWRMCQGKAREICHQTESGFKTTFAHPVDFVSEVAAQQNRIGNTKFDKAGMALRARIIMPHKWRFNMFDGTIAKLFAGPLEHCRCGFPSLKVGSGYEQLYRSEVPKGLSVPWAFDVSHYETFSSSNEHIMLRMFGVNKWRKLFFEDAASGWLAGAKGRRYHGFQTSSGIGCTTMFAVIPGMFLCGIDVAYRTDNIEMFAKIAIDFWRKLLFEAIEFFKQHNNVADANPFGDHVEFPVYSWKGHDIRALISVGSDDQGGWDQSSTASEADIIDALTNERVTGWRKRIHADLSLGESSHFGIVRTKNGFKADETSSDWKWCFSERKSVGDLIALGATVAFSKTPGLEEDVQAALDAINGGSTKAYWLGAEVATAILKNNPEFCQRVIDYNYPAESPTGKRMSEYLEQQGFSTLDSNKLDVETTRDIVSTYIKFLEGQVE